MITAEGYSKDSGIIPEGIAVTFGREMMIEQGGVKIFLKEFQRTMSDHDEGNYWMHKCSNLPTRETDIIYIIVCNRLYGKVFCGGYHLYNPYAGITDEMDDEGSHIKWGYSADGKEKWIDWNHIILSGPFEKCPFKRTLRGFQGFRYCTKLF